MIALIVAFSKNRVIGNQGKIPWDIKGEKDRFRELTTGNIVIMGRKTFEEIGKPLPNRRTIVISTTKQFVADNCDTVDSLKRAIDLAKQKGGDIFISGGQKLYEEAIEFVQKMYITEIDEEVEGDTYFPLFEEEKFTKVIEKRVEAEIPYTYLTYERKEDVF